MSEFLEFTVIGVAVGAGYAILATGLVVTYTTSGVFNFAHGAVAMFAAFSYWELLQHGVPQWLGLVIVLLLGAPLAGAVIEFVFMRGLHGASSERPIMVTLGLLVILLGAGSLIWNVTTARSLAPLVSGTFPLFGVNLEWQNAALLVAAAGVAAVLWVLFLRTRLGVGMRAVVDNPELVSLAGVSPTRMSRAGWMLGFSLAAVAGVLIAPTLTVSFTVPIMTLLVVNAFAAAVVGRLRSMPWTFAGALALGLVTTYFGGYAPQHLPTGVGADVGNALPMIFLFVALVALPSVRLEAVGRLVAERLPRLPRGRESLACGLAFVIVVVVFSRFFNGTFLAPGVSAAGPVVAQALVYGIIGLSLVLLVGYAGQVSLAQFAFMGIGAFCMGKVAGGGSLLGLLAAVAVCAAVGALVALPVIRLRGLYLALATFAFADAVQLGFFSDTRVLGTTGISVARFSVAGVSFVGDRAELVMLGVVFTACAWGVLAVRRSALGRRLVAVDDSPAACATVGINPAVTKVVVFAIAAGMAGLGGALWGSLQGAVGISTFTIFYGVLFFLFLVIWGARSVTGAFLASLTYAIVENLPHVNSIDGMLLGGAGIVLIGRQPNGILGIEWLHERVGRLWARGPGRPQGLRRAVVGAGESAGSHGAAS